MAKVLVNNFIENYGEYAEKFPLVSPTGSIDNKQTIPLYIGLALIMGSFASFGLSTRNKEDEKENKKDRMVKLKNQMLDLFGNVIIAFGVILLFSTTISFGYFTDIFFSKTSSMNTKIIGLSFVFGFILFLYIKYSSTEPNLKTIIKSRKNDKISPILLKKLEKGRSYKQKLYTIFGYLLLFSSLSSLGYFSFIYFYKYKDQYNNWYKSLPTEAIEELQYIKDITSFSGHLRSSSKKSLAKFNQEQISKNNVKIIPSTQTSSVTQPAPAVQTEPVVQNVEVEDEE